MVVEQLKLGEILLYSFVFGICAGALYDLFRIRRREFSFARAKGRVSSIGKTAENLTVFFEDVIYSFVCSVCFCVFIFYFNSGRFRGVAVTGAFFGFLLYYNTLGRLVLAIAGRVIALFRKTAGILYRRIFLPICGMIMRLLGLTVGRVVIAIYTQISKGYWLKTAEKGFSVTGKKGKIKNEKTVKHIYEGGRRGVHTVLRRNHNSDAVPVQRAEG